MLDTINQFLGYVGQSAAWQSCQY